MHQYVHFGVSFHVGGKFRSHSIFLRTFWGFSLFSVLTLGLQDIVLIPKSAPTPKNVTGSLLSVLD